MSLTARIRGFLSLFESRYFIRDPQSSLRTVADKFGLPVEVAYCAGRVAEGLGPAERRMVEENVAPRARILDVGCGAGRCALPLAERGHDVVGIDVAPAMVAAARQAAQRREGALRGEVRFEVRSATSVDDDLGAFDVVLFSDGVYSLVPGSALRVEALQRASRALSPGGVMLLFPLYRRRTLLSRVELYGAVFRLARRLMPRRVLPEPGDVMRREVSPGGDAATLCYMHLFRDAAEVAGEIRRAGLEGRHDPESGAWIVRSGEDGLRSERLLQAARNLALAGELRSILEALHRRGIRCVPLRGPAIAEALYGDLGARPMGDLDLLVERSALAAVGSLLEEMGFEEMDRRRGFSASYSYTLKFFKRQPTMVIVEPHWTIVYPPFVERLDMQEVWSRCLPTRVVGAPALALAGEDLIVHLAMHLAHRERPPRLWWDELDRTMRRHAGRLDWGLVTRIGRQAGVARLLARILGEAVATHASPVPESVLTELRSTDRSEPRASMAERLAQTGSVQEREGLAQLLAAPGLAGKMRYTGALLFPSPRFMMLEYDLDRRRELVPAYARRFAGFIWQGARDMARFLARPRAHP